MIAVGKVRVGERCLKTVKTVGGTDTVFEFPWEEKNNSTGSIRK